MKSLLKKALNSFVQNDFLWSIIGSKIVRIAGFIERARARIVLAKTVVDTTKALKVVSPDLTVKNGVFKGMKYAEAKAIGSSLLPKLIGSYENEIQPLVERICHNAYTEIVDIGCAEGYYAIGLAMRIPTATIYAYDTDEEAIRLCKQMAGLNNVSERLITGAFCDTKTLMSIPSNGKALIISDCEGYEKKLFTREIVSCLKRHELLIEVHDFIDIEISSYLRSLFEDTHDFEIFQSIDDIKKAQQYIFDELEGFDLDARRVLMSEGRPAIMEWFYLTPRICPVGDDQS